MKKKLIKIGVIIVFVLIILLLTFYVLKYLETNDYHKRGSALIDKIETFRQLKKRLPNNVEELGLEEPMNTGPYYEKKDSVNYVVFFNIGFDHDKIIYYSDKKEWYDDNNVE